MKMWGNKIQYLFGVLFIGLFPSCVGDLANVSDGVSSLTGGSSSGSSSRSSNSTAGDNSVKSVSSNNGRYLKDNPIILSGNYNLAANENLGKYLDSSEDFITSNTTLLESCTANGVERTDCLAAKSESNADFFSPNNNMWGFTSTSSYFRQVQAFGNVRDITSRFHTDLAFSYGYGNTYSYQSAHPSDLFSSTNPAFWFKQDSTFGIDGTLMTYSDCDIDDNAFFSPSRLEICLGKLSQNNLYIVTDPTVTFHEVGHAFNQIMLNTRNLASGTSFERDTNLGYTFYDEAGGIGEGLADFFSYYMNYRGHFGEWALGRFLSASRPMEESDSLHAPGVSESSIGRVSYPDFVPYDPNFPSERLEDIHFSGAIISHFMVALIKDVSSTCNMSIADSTQRVVHIVMETFAEMGDQTALGYDGATEYTINHSPDHAHDWISTVNPINFRSFMQVFSKYFMYTLGNASLNQCNGAAFSQTDYESLVDDYGLLLFKTYNEDGNGLTNGASGTNTAVTASERVKSVLIDKTYLRLDSRPGKPTAFVIDDQEDISAAMDSLKASGQINSVSSMIDPNFAYNNGNGKISPGEVVGVSLSLYNNSNSTMAGVQILANDWDHTKGGKPCNIFKDAWPLDTEGAADTSTGEGVEGGCDYVTRYNGSDTATEPNEELAPVCFVEINESTSTQWYQQSKLLDKIGLDSSNCLGGSDSEEDCFVRAIKGADTSFYSIIDPKSTWAETIVNQNGVPTFNFNNVIFFEINPWIPPGTVFNCRMRARFTNCDDCFHDETTGDNYQDYMFSGPDPFKIINFSFTVID